MKEGNNKTAESATAVTDEEDRLDFKGSQPLLFGEDNREKAVAALKKSNYLALGKLKQTGFVKPLRPWKIIKKGSGIKLKTRKDSEMTRTYRSCTYTCQYLLCQI